MNGRRALVLGAASAALVGGTGCFTYLAGNFVSKNEQVEGGLVLTDTIQALGKLNKSAMSNTQSNDPIVFLGAKNSYYLVRGGDQLFKFASHPDLKGVRFGIIPSNKSIFMSDGKVWGTIDVSYGDDGAPLSRAEIDALESFRFSRTDRDTDFHKQVEFMGKIYPAVDLGQAGLKPLARTYSLSFYAPPSTVKKPDWDVIALLPAALYLDYATAPVQLMGFILLGLGVK